MEWAQVAAREVLALVQAPGLALTEAPAVQEQVPELAEASDSTEAASDRLAAPDSLAVKSACQRQAACYEPEPHHHAAASADEPSAEVL